jgi:fatty acid desaturase
MLVWVSGESSESQFIEAPRVRWWSRGVTYKNRPVRKITFDYVPLHACPLLLFKPIRDAVYHRVMVRNVDFDSRHARITLRLTLETILVFVVLSGLAVWVSQHLESFWAWVVYAPVLLMQALWFERLYIVGHEAAHKKLIPWNRTANDALGQGLMLPILFPVSVYRKVHYFHHGFNRKDHHHSALDVFVTRWRITPLVRAYYFALWYLGIFAGGFLLHSVASVIVFLFIPTERARTISPAFENWTARDRVTAWLQLLACIAFHVAVYALLGARAYWFTLGYPFLAFAWVWSLLIYIFHYQTTLGADVRFNVRSLEQHWLLSWVMLNFNQHTTHHGNPSIPWYGLLERRQDLPQRYARNQNTGNFWRAIAQQLRGPTIVHTDDPNPTPHLFVRWED